MIEFTASRPPSANRLWRRSGHRLHRSAEYTSWLVEAGWQARSQARGSIAGKYSLTYVAGRTSNVHFDLDNYVKPINDLLKSIGIILNDKDCDELHGSWTEGEGIFVRVQAI